MLKRIVICTRDGKTFVGDTYESHPSEKLFNTENTIQDMLEIDKVIEKHKDDIKDNFDWKVEIVHNNEPMTFL